ncbi:MAG: hypothetical protein IPG08_12945 [Sphingobacteriaceae bacterium]|nr:hypothetical protein [Sphingobacteriaceae bacterium]
MKKILLIALTFIVLISCEKRKEITYPTSMTYGDNILAMDNITQGKDYSFGAKLGKKASLKIVMSNLSVQTNTNFPKPVWFYSNQQG